jgi:hypothetical protein
VTRTRIPSERPRDTQNRPESHRCSSGRPHGTRARYVLGPDIDDNPGKGCRCDNCREANAEYERERSRRLAMEKWHPERARWVDAAPVRKHVRSLMASKTGATDGVGLKRIAKLSGVSGGALWKLVYGKRRPDGSRIPSQRIHRDTAAKLLAVSRDGMADGASVEGRRTHKLAREIVTWYDSSFRAPPSRKSDSPNRVKGRGGKAWLARQLTGNPDTKALQLGTRNVSVRHARRIRQIHDRLWEEHASFRWRYCSCPDVRRSRRDVAS